MFEVSDYLIWLTAALVGWAFRHVRTIREWRRVRKLAIADVKRSGDLGDREAAVTRALGEVNRERIRRESKQVTRLVLNGTGPHRKQEP